jgi:hypothetical protein
VSSPGGRSLSCWVMGGVLTASAFLYPPDAIAQLVRRHFDWIKFSPTMTLERCKVRGEIIGSLVKEGGQPGSNIRTTRNGVWLENFGSGGFAVFMCVPETAVVSILVDMPPGQDGSDLASVWLQYLKTKWNEAELVAK